MARDRARRRRVPRINVPGHYYGMGPQVQDAVSGVWMPIVDTVRQRGGRVSRYRRDGSLDEPSNERLNAPVRDEE
jgi:hypothetical protein